MLPRSSVFSALVLVGTLLAADYAAAQSQGLPFSRQGTYLYQETQPSYSYSPSAPMTVPAAPTNTYQSFYPTIPAEQQKVFINATVPANAKLSFQGGMTQQTGPQRFFESPTLTPGLNYSYVVEARWMANGREMIVNRRFSVQPGDSIDLTITPDAAVNVSRSN